MAQKKVVGYVNLTIPAGQANPSPPIGPALGQRGLNIMEFCKAFNAATQQMEAGTPIPVIITAYKDRSFSFITKTPPASFFLRRAAGLKGGAKTPGRAVIGSVTASQVEEIAQAKRKDLSASSLEGAVRTIEGAARSMGIEIKG